MTRTSTCNWLRSGRPRPIWRCTQRYRATRTDIDLLFGFVACCSPVKLDYRVHGPSLGLELAL